MKRAGADYPQFSGPARIFEGILGVRINSEDNINEWTDAARDFALNLILLADAADNDNETRAAMKCDPHVYETLARAVAIADKLISLFCPDGAPQTRAFARATGCDFLAFLDAADRLAQALSAGPRTLN